MQAVKKEDIKLKISNIKLKIDECGAGLSPVGIRVALCSPIFAI
jgi:hypothetical protein